jgi:hypothetical protein
MKLIAEKAKVVTIMDEKTAHYARVAETYWQTFLPSQNAKIPPDQRQAFFQDLGRQVPEQVAYLAADSLRATSRATDPPVVRERRARMAELGAEEEALAELVYLPKEPGTDDRQMPRTHRIQAHTPDPEPTDS